MSVSSTGEEGNNPLSDQFLPISISGDGRYIAFNSDATNLVEGPLTSNLFVHDRQTGATTPGIVNSQGEEFFGFTIAPAFSADGRFLVFSGSDSSNLARVFVNDRLNGGTALVNLTHDGFPGPGDSYPAFGPAISANGRFLAFESQDSALVLIDTNDVMDIFVHERNGEVNSDQSLNVTVAGNGTITSNLDGIACSPDCSEDYVSGTVVFLSATPATGSVFTGWNGTCSGTAPCTVVMTQGQSVTATFEPESSASHLLSVSLLGTSTGVITSAPGGIVCPGDCSENYTENTAVTLIAAPAPDANFDGWSGRRLHGNKSLYRHDQSSAFDHSHLLIESRDSNCYEGR